LGQFVHYQLNLEEWLLSWQHRIVNFLDKGLVSVFFDKLMKTTNGFVSGTKMMVNDSPVVHNNLSGLFKERKLTLIHFTKFGTLRLR
jgi:hypothetical protein